MHEAVYQVMTTLCALVGPLPIGTNLGMLHLLWMLVSGRLLGSRGALFPGLSEAGLSDDAVRRAWAALGQGAWTSDLLLQRWRHQIEQAGRWQPHTHGGYHPVAVDVTGFWRPRLRGCPTTHYHAEAGKALPAIPIGIIARVGSVAGQRLGLPLGLVRVDPTDPSPRTHARQLVQAAVDRSAPDDVLVVDGGFGVALLQEVGAHAYVARVAKNFTARRATLPAYKGRGARPKYGEVVRPLARSYKGRVLPGTPPDRVTTWTEGTVTLRAEEWTDLVLADAAPDSPTCTVVAIYDPRFREPLLLATPLALPPQAVRDLYRDRWPVEQIPLAAKQMLGAARQFVHDPETCQRLPELALLAGAILSYVAATTPAVPTGFWDRQPQPTPGRLRRVLARCSFPDHFPLPARIREKASVTDHLPTGWWGQRHCPAAVAAELPAAVHPEPAVQAA
jgi:hypothetical protein